MWPDRVSNPGPLIYESGVLPTALRGPARPQISYSLRRNPGVLRLKYFILTWLFVLDSKILSNLQN